MTKNSGGATRRTRTGALGSLDADAGRTYGGTQLAEAACAPGRHGIRKLTTLLAAHAAPTEALWSIPVGWFSAAHAAPAQGLWLIRIGWFPPRSEPGGAGS